MIIFRPLDAVLESFGGCASPSRFYSAEEWLLIWAHFVEQHQAAAGGRRRYVVRNDWGILNSRTARSMGALEPFDPASAGTDACARLAALFVNAGQDNQAGLLLWRYGVRSLADLETTIRISGRVPNWGLHWWGNQRARVLKAPGPNRFHPEARWIEGCRVAYSAYWHRWDVYFSYGFPHDGPTSWSVGVSQKRGECLDRFGARVTSFIDERFEPDDNRGAMFRAERERAWDRIEAAAGALFPWGARVPPDYSKQIADILADVDGVYLRHGRFNLTPRRLGTLKRWAREALSQPEERK